VDTHRNEFWSENQCLYVVSKFTHIFLWRVLIQSKEENGLREFFPKTVSKNSDSSAKTHSLWILISEHAKTNYLNVKVKVKLSLCMPRMHTGEWRPYFAYFLTHIHDGDSQLHTPATLMLEKEHPPPTEQKALWSPKHGLGSLEKIRTTKPSQELKHDSLATQPTLLSTVFSWLL